LTPQLTKRKYKKTGSGTESIFLSEGNKNLVVLHSLGDILGGFLYSLGSILDGFLYFLSSFFYLLLSFLNLLLSLFLSGLLLFGVVVTASYGSHHHGCYSNEHEYFLHSF